MSDNIQWMPDNDESEEFTMSPEQVQVLNLARSIQMQFTGFEQRLKLFTDEKVATSEPARTLEYLTYMKSYLNEANRVLREAEKLQS